MWRRPAEEEQLFSFEKRGRPRQASERELGKEYPDLTLLPPADLSLRLHYCPVVKGGR